MESLVFFFFNDSQFDDGHDFFKRDSEKTTNFGMPPVSFQEGLTDPTMNENTLKNAGNLRLVGILCEVVTVVSAVEKEEILLKSVS